MCRNDTTIFRYFIEDLLHALGIPNASTSVTSQVCVNYVVSTSVISQVCVNYVVSTSVTSQVCVNYVVSTSVTSQVCVNDVVSMSVISQVCVYDVTRLTKHILHALRIRNKHCIYISNHFILFILIFLYRHLLCHLYLELLFLITGYLCCNVNNCLPKIFVLGNKSVLCPVESRHKGSYPSLASF